MSLAILAPSLRDPVTWLQPALPLRTTPLHLIFRRRCVGGVVDDTAGEVRGRELQENWATFQWRFASAAPADLCAAPLGTLTRGLAIGVLDLFIAVISLT